MGLSASQARFLTLFARKSDLEYRGQIINNRRTAIAWDSARISEEYNEAISNRVLLIKDGEDRIALTAGNLQYKYQCQLVYQKADGSYAPITDDPAAYPAWCDTADEKAKYNEEKLREGTWKLQKIVVNATEDDIVDWRTQLPTLIDVLDTSDDEAAKAKYEYESKEVQAQDRQLEVELKNVDTQHQAVQTEVDAVKKVIDKNIETSFKTLG
jgi:hypothetical protein